VILTREQWGSPDNKRKISLCGQAFEVTPNLYGALQNLRLRTTVDLIDYFKPSRRFWIDAVCINQEDIQERSQQVLLMWSIYSKASRVVVWLGEEQDNSSLGMEMVRLLDLNFELKKQKLLAEISAEIEGRGQPEGSQDERGEAEEVAEEISAATPTKRQDAPEENQGDIQEGLPERTEQSQEKAEGSKGNINLFFMTEKITYVNDPKVMATMLSSASQSDGGKGKGQITMPDGRRLLNEEEQSMIPFRILLPLHNDPNAPDPEEWVAFQKLMERPWWRRIWVVQEVAAAKNDIWVGCGSYWLPWEKFLGAALTIESYKNHPFVQRIARLGVGASAILDKSKFRAKTDGRLDKFGGLLNLLFYFRNYEATDPRDRVFALLGFTPSIPVVPDYTKTAEEVYEELVRTSIQVTGSCMMIFLCRKPKRLQLPSWVPDFSVNLPDDAWNVSCPLGFFGADGNNWANVGVPSAGCTLNPRDQKGKLTVNGFVYDTPLVLGPVWDGTLEERQSRFYKIIPEYQRLLDETDSSHFPHLTGQHRNECFWRTLIWNANKEDRYPAPAEFGKLFERLCAEEQLLANINEPTTAEHLQRVIPSGPPAAYYEAFVRHGFKRCFFITKRGNLGSGPPDMREGDLICIILGSKTPVVLRGVGSEGRYELVGHAYVHGIMHGEGLGAMPNDMGLDGTRSMGIVPFCLV
jgi:hypothetical protein